MDFLFDNPLANLYGPYFLLLYGFFIIATIIGFRVLRNRLDQTARFSLPPISTNPNPFEIAYLRGGANELTRTVIFSLAKKNLLKFANDDKTSRILPVHAEFDKRALSPLEQTALGWFSGSREAKELFTKGGLTERLNSYGETYQARLEINHFFPDAEMKAQNSRLARTAFLIFGSLGAYKFIAALYHGYSNVLGIIFVTLGGLLVLGLAAKMPRLTILGKMYLERLQLAFEKIKPSNHNQISEQTAAFAAVDPFLLSVGVFGGAALAGTMYSDYNLAFQRAQSQSAVSTGSCGSSCGSGSCSSGGDGGGGSSCGGGCGGCGGGCGG